MGAAQMPRTSARTKEDRALPCRPRGGSRGFIAPLKQQFAIPDDNCTGVQYAFLAMDFCRICNRPIRVGQKTWRLGTDVEHERCAEERPIIQRLEQLRSAVRALNAVRADLCRLGQSLLTDGLHERKNRPPVDVETPMRRASDQLREVAKLLRD
jgi:hypothetical protein